MLLCVDVNFLVHAANTASDRHGAVRDWLVNALSLAEPLVIPDVVSTGFIRMLSGPHVMPSPMRG